jgi:hypothetical protein
MDDPELLANFPREAYVDALSRRLRPREGAALDDPGAR